MNQAGVYAAVLYWMKAIDAMDKPHARDGAAVVARMKEMPAPAESRSPYDLYKLVSTMPGGQAFRPIMEGGCNLVIQ